MSTSGNTGPLGKPRGIGFGILIFIVTFGLYSLYWVYQTQEEVKRHSGDGIGGVLGLVVWIIVGAISAFVIPSEVGKMYEKDGREAPITGWTGLWLFPGAILIIPAIVWFVKVQGALNRYLGEQGSNGGLVSRLVVVVPLKDGAAEKARALLAKGPPFDLEATEFDRHEVYLSEREAVFLFETPGPSATLKLPGEDPSLWKVAAAWQPLHGGQASQGPHRILLAAREVTGRPFLRADAGPGRQRRRRPVHACDRSA